MKSYSDKMEILEWIGNWYKAHCDGVWEDDHGIDIQTMNNPGWQVRIELHGTPFVNLEVDWTSEQIDDENWWGYKIEYAVFDGICDPTRLSLLLNKFKEVIEDQF